MLKVVVDHLGNKYSSVAEMCNHYGVNFNVFKERLRRGWSVKDALTTDTRHTAVGTKKKSDKEFENWLKERFKNHNSQSKGVKELLEFYGIESEKTNKNGENKMEKKYELTHDSITVEEYSTETGTWYPIKLYRIRALRDFNDVKTSELGGYVQKEENLSHEGNCWVYDDAQVYGNARVFDDAKVSDNAEVHENAQVFECAHVYEDSRIYGNAKVYGHAHVYDINDIYGDVEICDYTKVFGCELMDNVKVYDNAIVYGITAHDNVCICKDTCTSGMCTRITICEDAYITSIDDLMYLNIGGKETIFFRLRNGNVGVYESRTGGYKHLEDYKRDAIKSNSKKLTMAQLAEIHFSK